MRNLLNNLRTTNSMRESRPTFHFKNGAYYKGDWVLYISIKRLSLGTIVMEWVNKNG